MKRTEVSEDEIYIEMQRFINEFQRRRNEKGNGTFASTLEILGSVTQEYHEVMAAQHERRVERMRNELLDLAVACVFGAACIGAGNMDF